MRYSGKICGVIFWVLYISTGLIGIAQTNPIQNRNSKSEFDQERSSLFEQLKPLIQQKLEHEKAKEWEDLGRVNIKMGQILWDKSLKGNAISYFEGAVREFEKADRTDTLPYLHIFLAKKYESVQDLTNARKHCRLGLVQLNSQKQKERNVQQRSIGSNNKSPNSLKQDFLRMMNNLYENKDNPEDYIRINQQYLDVLGKEADSAQLAKINNNLGNAFLSKKDLNEAESFFKTAVTIEGKRKGKTTEAGLVDYSINLAKVYHMKGMKREADKLLASALDLCIKDRLYLKEAQIQTFRSKIKLSENNLMLAHQFSKKSMELLNQASFVSFDIREDVYNCHATVLKRSGKYSEAYQVLEKLLEFKNKEINEEKKKYMELMARNEEEMEVEKQFQFTDEFVDKYSEDLRKKEEIESFQRQKLELLSTRQKNDSLNLVDINKTQKLLQSSYELSKTNLELSKKENEKKLLQEQFNKKLIEGKLREQAALNREQENNLLQAEKDAKLTKILSEKEKAATKAESDKYRLYAVLVGLCFTIAAVAFGYSRRSNSRLKASQLQIESVNMALGSLNKELNGKNKSITDSIQYAQGIQAAILPDDQRWKSVFPDSFVFYQPKDIVSGDFYFHTVLNSKQIIAYADCTGHGVPGALMSIIGHNLLVSAIDLQGLDNPGQILGFLNHGLRNTLRKENRDSHDGMEIGILSFDYQTGIMEYSGSRRPLFGMRNGEFFEWKGERFHLGSTRFPDAVFQTYTCPISEVSELWLTSDGYQDQFGGTENKRFHTSRLRELFISVAGTPASEQLAEVTRQFYNWIGSTIQIDDVMIIGIRPQSLNV